MARQEKPAVGVLMLAGRMADVPGCMASDASFAHPVHRKVVSGSSTPRRPADIPPMLPNYLDAARELRDDGVDVITANCGLLALAQQQVADAVDVPVVLSSLIAVPTVARMIGPHRRVGILTFFVDAVGEENFTACGWSSSEFPVSVAGVGRYRSWNRFLETKEMDGELRARLRDDLLEVITEFLARESDIGALVSECTMLPAVLSELRPLIPVPVFDILTVIDWAVSGSRHSVVGDAH